MAGVAALILNGGGVTNEKSYASRNSKLGFVVLIVPHTPRDLECCRISYADPEWGSYKLKPTLLVPGR
jgi:hypothetical protein